MLCVILYGFPSNSRHDGYLCIDKKKSKSDHVDSTLSYLQLFTGVRSTIRERLDMDH